MVDHRSKQILRRWSLVGVYKKMDLRMLSKLTHPRQVPIFRKILVYFTLFNTYVLTIRRP